MADPTKPSSQDKDPASAPGSTIGTGKVSAGKYDINTKQQLHNFEHEFADAYEASSADTGQSDHVAVVIKGRYPARKDIIDVCMTTEILGLIALKTTLVVDWPDDTQRYVLIYKRPEGSPIFQHNGQRREPVAEEIIRRGILRPIFQTLLLMSDRSMFHGNIRPTNIFMTQTDNPIVTLGDCASSIPGIIQPIVYETIERGMTDRQSRGPGNEYDDIYALGVTIAVLLRGYNPFEGKSDRFIIEEKINRGSFYALTDGLRLSTGLGEFLRATLNDEQRQRWDIEQLGAWIDGNRTTPKQSSSGTKAQRSLDFNGKKYIRPRLLAKDLQENQEEAVALIESGNLVKWIDRAVSDQVLVSYLNTAIGRASSTGRTTGYEDRLICYVSMALDPQAPIRYKNLKVLPGGIGHTLALAMLNDENVQTHAELIREKYAWTWLGYKENFLDARNSAAAVFDQASKIIVRRGINYGIERCLYELCPDTPCLSDYFKNFYVANCEVLLQAINKIAPDKKDSTPIDRHISSYITINDTRDNAGLMLLIEGTNPIKRSLAMITLYQQLQRRYNIPKLEDLCKWLVKDAEIVAQRLKNLSAKESIIKQIPKEAASGSLTRLLSLVDNAQQIKHDDSEFLKATYQYASYNNESEKIQHDLQHNPNYGFNTGRQIAMVISVALACLIAIISILMYFKGGA